MMMMKMQKVGMKKETMTKTKKTTTKMTKIFISMKLVLKLGDILNVVNNFRSSIYSFFFFFSFVTKKIKYFIFIIFKDVFRCNCLSIFRNVKF